MMDCRRCGHSAEDHHGPSTECRHVNPQGLQCLCRRYDPGE